LKIWMDALTPKQLIFLDAIRRRLKELGHDVLTTTRSYHDATYVVQRLGLDVTFVGGHGGASVSAKLEASLRRSLDLARMMEGRSFDMAFSFSSPEASRVAFGLGIPHYAANDSPHAQAVARLSIPLSKLLFTPFVIPPSAWVRLGVASEDLRRYHAIDAAAWVKHPERWPGPNEVEKAAKHSIVLRLEESQASYLLGGDSDSLKLVLALADRFPERRIVLLTRYAEQESLFGSVKGNVTVCTSPFFGVNILKDAALLVGRGGTMNAEAALLGVPTVSYFPGRATYIDRYLERKNALVLVKNDGEALKAAEELLREKGGERKRRAKALLDGMEDPAEFISRKLLQAAAQ
jgi:predicted glycosyltransferase